MSCSFNGRQLILGDAGSYYVFGQPAGWDPAAGVQAAAAVADDADAPLCDPVASGTTVLIAGWTAITHTAGRVGMCPARPGGPGTDPLPAIYQQAVVPTDVSAAIVVPSVGNRITRAFSCRFVLVRRTPGRPTSPTAAVSTPRTYDLLLSTSGEALVDSLRVMLTGTENVDTPNNLIRNRQSRFTVRRADGTEICRSDFVTGMPNGGLTSSFDLKELPGTCSTTDIYQNELNGGRIVSSTRWSCCCCHDHPEHRHHRGTGRDQRGQRPRRIGVQPGQRRVELAGERAHARRRGGHPADAVRRLRLPGRRPGPHPDAGHAVRPRAVDSATSRSRDCSAPRTPTSTPSISTLRAVVKVKPSNTVLPAAWTSLFGNFIDIDNFLAPMRTFIELETPDGSRCITQGSGMNSDQEIAFDLLSVDLEDPAAPPAATRWC